MAWNITLFLLTLLVLVNGQQDSSQTGQDGVTSSSEEPRDNATAPVVAMDTDEDRAFSEQEYFVRKIFDKYGYQGRITFEGFEHLLESLGLAKLRIADHDIHDHIAPDRHFKKLHNDHIHFGSKNRGKKRHRKNRKRHRKTGDDVTRRKRNHANKLWEKLIMKDIPQVHTRHGGLKSYEFDGGLPPSDQGRSYDDARGYHGDVKRERRSAGAEESSCLTSWEMLNVYSVRQENGITEDSFMKICPAMVYQLDIHACTQRYRQDCFHQKKKKHMTSFHSNSDLVTEEPDEDEDGNHGDHDGNHGDGEEEEGHSHGVMSERLKNWSIHTIPTNVWGFATLSVTIISLVGLLGVAIVPIMQKVFYNHLIQFLVALAVGSLTGDALLHLLPHAIQSSTGEGTHEKSGVYKGLVALGGIYFFFIAERLMAIVTEKRKKKRAKARRRRSLREAVVGQKLSEYAGTRSHSCEDIVMVLGPNKVEVESQVMELKEHAAAQHAHSHSHDNDSDLDNVKVKDGKGHGHGHSHGDGKPPTSIAAVAWMVILGDGLHNFSDGLAIGAAFANSMTGGLSTSVAVFCHELPHELGDFAVLLKAGMSAKQALFYNMVSSVLCFAGMLIGVALGNISSASLWIFAIAGGMFIYIALVDMLPEISVVETRPGESVCCHLLLHLLGISVGLGIMLLIALFEDQIRVSVNEP